MKDLRFKIKDLRIGKLSISAYLLVICAFFLITRLYQIDSNPPSLYWDEASIGYNAYSILKTGHDEWGTRTPVHFRAFGEFKLPVYIYSVTISEAIFGLNSLAIRLPAVLYSLASLILIYLLVKKITQREVPSLFSAFAFAISPWFFIFSRTGYEATAGVFFFLLAIYFFLFSQQKKYFLLLAVFSLIFSIYSYNSFRLLSGLTIVAALSYSLWTSRTKKTILISLGCLILFTLSTIPILRVLLLDGGFSRVESFALLPTVQQVYDSDGKPQIQIIFDRTQDHDWWGNITKIGQNYFSHYSPQFLFHGDSNPRNQQPGLGQIYWIDLDLAFVGLFALWKIRKFHFGLLLFLLFIAPIPAALFKEAPHALRSILMAPVLAILIGLGAWWLSKKFKFLYLIFPLLYLAFFGFYFYNFFTTYPAKASADWQYGYQQIYQQFGDQFPNYDNIIISDDYGQPYIFALTYLKINPDYFQKNSEKNPVNDWGFSTINHFNKFYFLKESKLADNSNLDYPGRSLIFMAKPLGNRLAEKQINFLNGQPAFFVYTMGQ